MSNTAKETTTPLRSEFWGIRCESGKKYSQTVQKRFHITMAALDTSVIPTDKHVPLMVERSDKQYLLCTLKPEILLQTNLNLVFDKGERVTFFLKGRGTIHLSGYHILDEAESSTEPLNKGQSHSPVKKENASPQKSPAKANLNASPQKSPAKANLNASPQKSPAKANLNAKASPSKKAALEQKNKSEQQDDSDDSDEELIDLDEEDLETLAKSRQKISELTSQGKESKKSFDDSDDGSEDDLDLSDIDIDVSDDDESEDESDEEPEKTKGQSKQAAKRARDEESDEDEDSSNSEPKLVNSKSVEVKKSPVKGFQNPKKFKPDASTPVLNAKKSANPLNKSGFKSLNSSELDSSIGRTPMPKKSAMKKSLSGKNTLSPTKEQSSMNASAGEEIDLDSDSDEAKIVDTPTKPEAVVNQSQQETPSSKKKKKRKRKSKANVEGNDNKQGANQTNESLTKSPSGKKLAGGVEFEDIRVGSGPPARKGKLVHVYYTGKLESGKVFDSCDQGGKPFSFKLGKGDVISGWDVGIEGMKVGGKRKLKIPPQMGYKNVKTGPIPPNSTLNFVVELKAVS